MKKVYLQKIRSESKDGTLYITVCDNFTTAKQVEYISNVSQLKKLKKQKRNNYEMGLSCKS